MNHQNIKTQSIMHQFCVELASSQIPLKAAWHGRGYFGCRTKSNTSNGGYLLYQSAYDNDFLRNID
ncbi:unnamed protein product [Nesidiocoris tenuis]|uniref:Uncharacterized protein n=1 Tax=Nesidiocoris tenuis TaxID=355587 RepID=A0A6H5HVI3_9HEMI|nr:unnamed protein product [Nesidiocoris tenuis]